MFFPSKVQVYVWFLIRPSSKAQSFFSFGATLPIQKVVKEIAYIPTSFQAPKSAIFLKKNLFIDQVKKTIGDGHK